MTELYVSKRCLTGQAVAPRLEGARPVRRTRAVLEGAAVATLTILAAGAAAAVIRACQ